MREVLLGGYLWIKALHIAAVIAWMAGMMYLPRLFAYHHQAKPGGEAEALFVVMERRLLKGIINPAMIAAWLLGLLMLYLQPALLSAGWLHVKLALALVMSGVHGYYARARKAFEAGRRPRSARFWKILNEGPFVLLLAILFLAIVKPF